MKTVIILKYQIPDSELARVAPLPECNMKICADNMSGSDDSKYPIAATFNHLSSEFGLLPAIKDFLDGENESQVTLCFPLKETPWRWIFSLYMSDLKKIQWIENKESFKFNILPVIFFKIPHSVKSIIIRVRKTIFVFIWKIRTSPRYNISRRLNHLVKKPAKKLSVTEPGQIKILNFIGSLGAGGSERQLCNFVSGIKSRGYTKVRVLTTESLQGYDAHYLQRLKKADISVSSIDLHAHYRRHPDIDLLLIMHRYQVRAIYNEIIKDPPDVFHAWLDYTNTLGGIAALIAGVPVIILSTRSVSPYHFPHLFTSWFKPYYNFLAKNPNVHFINNSTNGGNDYAKWLGLPAERFKIVLNGVDFEEMKRPSQEKVEAFRKSLNISSETIILCGIFRLTAEKRPELFFKITDFILNKYKNVCVIHAGDGPMKIFLEQEILKAGHKERFILLGNRDDVPVILSASDIFLLTSENEGTPNVILEAGWFGCSTVSTAAGGVPDCIEQGKTGFVHAVDDEAGLIQSISMLIENESLRKDISEAAPEFIRNKFSLEKMLSETLELYK